jgi:hypothetical protein
VNFSKKNSLACALPIFCGTTTPSPPQKHLPFFVRGQSPTIFTGWPCRGDLCQRRLPHTILSPQQVGFKPDEPPNFQTFLLVYLQMVFTIFDSSPIVPYPPPIAAHGTRHYQSLSRNILTRPPSPEEEPTHRRQGSDTIFALPPGCL